jgi:hypothetical protein
MDECKIKERRAEIIERSINIESIVSTVICQHYLKLADMKFITEVLYDESFTVGLKLNILNKFIKEPEYKDLVQNLRRLNRIRNIFAHCGPELISIKDNHQYILDPKNPDKEDGIDFEALHQEFLSLAGKTELNLAKLFQAKGGEILNKQ